MTTKRDLQLEQSKLGEFMSMSGGKEPKTSEDWNRFAKYVYGSNMPDELQAKFTQTATPAPAPAPTSAPADAFSVTSNPTMYQGMDISPEALSTAREQALSYTTPSTFLDKVKTRLQEKFKPEGAELGMGSFSESLGPLDPAGIQAGIAEKSGQFKRKGLLALKALSTANDIYSEQADKALQKFNMLQTAASNYEAEQKEALNEIKNLAIQIAAKGQPIPNELLDLLPQDQRQIYDKLPSLLADQNIVPDLVEIDGKKYQYNSSTGTFSEPDVLSGDTKFDPITGAPTIKSKLIDGYNFTSYAVDPNWGNSVRSILGNIGKFETLDQVQSYIDTHAPNSNITAQNISNTSAKYGIPWEMLVAITQHESGLGTSNVALKNNNLSGMTWTGSNGIKGTARPSREGGYYVKYPTIQEGLDALGRNIARRKQVSQVASGEELNKNDLILSQIKNGLITKTRVSEIIESSNDPVFISQLNDAINSPKNKNITTKESEDYNVASNLTKGQLDEIIQQRMNNGFGNRQFQSIDDKEYDQLINAFNLRRKLTDIKALKLGGEYIKTLLSQEQTRIFNEYKDDFGVESIEELLTTKEQNTGPIQKTKTKAAEFVYDGGNPRVVALDVLSGKYGVDYMKDISGVAISENEAKRLLNLVPGVGLDDTRFNDTTNQAVNELDKLLLRNAERYGFNSLDEFDQGTRRVRNQDYINLDEDTLDSLYSGSNTGTQVDNSDQLLKEVLGDSYIDDPVDEFLNSF